MKTGEYKGDGWLCGYAAALSCISRLHDQPGLVSSALIADGLTIPILETAGVDDYDLDLIKKSVAGASASHRAILE